MENGTDKRVDGSEDSLPPDFLVLHHTVVRGEALPPHFEDAFYSSEVPPILAARQDRNISMVTNMEALTWLQEKNKPKEQETWLEKTAAHQFFLAADKAPRRYRAKFQLGLYAGPNARKDAEETEPPPRWRHCWLRSNALWSSWVQASELQLSGLVVAQSSVSWIGQP